MKPLALLFLALAATTLQAQPQQQWGPDVVPNAYTVATLPTSISRAGLIVRVTDAVSTSDCTVGHGSAIAFCWFNGSVWSAINIDTGFSFNIQDLMVNFIGKPCTTPSIGWATDGSPGHKFLECDATNVWNFFANDAAVVAYGNGAPGAGACDGGIGGSQKFFYVDSLTSDIWECGGTYRKLLTTTNSGTFSMTVQNGSDACGTVSAGLDCVQFNASGTWQSKDQSGNITPYARAYPAVNVLGSSVTIDWTVTPQNFTAWQFNVGGYPDNATENINLHIEALSGKILIPSSANHAGAGVGVQGYSMTQSGTTSAMAMQGIALVNVNGSSGWGGNWDVGACDRKLCSVIGATAHTAGLLNAGEFDVQTPLATGIAYGVSVYRHASTIQATEDDAFIVLKDTSALSPTPINWKVGYKTGPGCCDVAFFSGPKSGGSTSIQSQAIQWASLDAGGTVQLAAMNTNLDGGFQMAAGTNATLPWSLIQSGNTLAVINAAGVLGLSADNGATYAGIVPPSAGVMSVGPVIAGTDITTAIKSSGTGQVTIDGNPIRKVLASAGTNATTTFSALTGLSFSAAASRSYQATCYITWQGSAGTTGPKFQWTGPVSPTAVSVTLQSAVTATTSIYAAANAFSSAVANTGTITTATDFPAVVTIGVVNGANAGTVQLQAAANGAGTLTVEAGSYCEVGS